jgi:hypothetical protein
MTLKCQGISASSVPSAASFNSLLDSLGEQP